MPAYSREGKTVVVFFQGAQKFGARYATIGFNDSAHLDEGWAVALGIPVRSTDNTVVLDDPEVEAVVITAPSGLHSELIQQAAAAGKHIFCEKPVGFEEGPIGAGILP